MLEEPEWEYITNTGYEPAESSEIEDEEDFWDDDSDLFDPNSDTDSDLYEDFYDSSPEWGEDDEDFDEDLFV